MGSMATVKTVLHLNQSHQKKSLNYCKKYEVNLIEPTTQIYYVSSKTSTKYNILKIVPKFLELQIKINDFLLDDDICHQDTKRFRK